MSDDLKIKGSSEKGRTSVEFELPEDILESIKEESKRTGDTVENIISKGLGTHLKDKYIDEERHKEIGDIIGDLSIKELESEVLHFMASKPSEFAHGSEGEIFKMHIPGKKDDVMIVKRPYKETGEKEYDLHKKAKEVEILYNKENPGNIVKVPSIFHHFNDGNDDYVVMEYIKGKTLYLKIIEEILSSETILLGEKIKDEELKKLFYYHYYYFLENKIIGDIDMEEFFSLSIEEILKLLMDEKGYLKKIDLECDSKGEDKFKVLYGILKDAGVKFDGDPKDVFKLAGDAVNKMIYNKVNFNDFVNIGFLSNTQKVNLSNNLNKFLTFSHKKGFYHMDLGCNTRNIILTEKDGLYTPTIIDFGKSKFLGEETNSTLIEKADDFFIIKNFIEKLEVKEKKKLINNSIEKLCDLNKEFKLNKEDIIANYNYYERYPDIIFFNNLKEVLFSGEIPGQVKLDLGKNGEEKYNSMVLSKIITLMYFTREENFGFISKYIDELEKDKNFKIPFKKKIISIYRDLYQKISEIRKAQD